MPCWDRKCNGKNFFGLDVVPRTLARLITHTSEPQNNMVLEFVFVSADVSAQCRVEPSIEEGLRERFRRWLEGAYRMELRMEGSREGYMSLQGCIFSILSRDVCRYGITTCRNRHITIIIYEDIGKSETLQPRPRIHT